jgi:hypothetical protein
VEATALAATKAENIIELPEVRRWLAEHGLDVAQVSDVTIHIGRHYGSKAVHVWLDVDWYTTDQMGCRYVTGNRESAAAHGHSTIPLKSWPALTPVT